jgi:hypothetical protein
MHLLATRCFYSERIYCGAQDQMNTIDYIGFDIHKKTISFCAKAQDGTILEEGTIPALRNKLLACMVVLTKRRLALGRSPAPFSRATVQQYRSGLEPAGLAPPSINLTLSAIRMLAAESAESGCSIAAWPRKSCPSRASANPAPGQGTDSPGNRRATFSLSPTSKPWKESGTGRFWRCFWAAPWAGASSPRSSRRHVQQHDGRWVFVDLVGKGE